MYIRDKIILWVVICVSAFICGHLLGKIFADPKQIKVEIEARVLKNDKFQLFYASHNEKFSEQNSSFALVNESENFQKIIWFLPLSMPIDRIRIDLGNNKNQQFIEINSIVFKSESYSIVFENDSINQFFIPNSFISIVEDKYIFTPKGNRYDPFLVSENILEIYDSLIEPYPFTKYPYIWSFSLFLIIGLYLSTKTFTIRYGIVINFFFLTIFFLILILPILNSAIKIIPEYETQEKRELVEFPSLSFTKEFAKKFEIYYNDNFGLRATLISWGASLKANFFKSSPKPEKIFIGIHGWLFYNTESVQNSYKKINLLSQTELLQLKNMLEERKEYLNKNEIEYLYAFWPNKHNIYPEYLPWMIKMQIRDTISLAEQISIFLKEKDADVQLIDVRETLLAQKSQQLLYRKLDTHWNSYGAYFAYQGLLNSIQNDKSRSSLTIDEFNINWRSHKEGDLIDLIGVDEHVYVDSIPSFKLKNNKNTIKRYSNPSLPSNSFITENNLAKDSRTLLYFCDSYSIALFQFLSLHFKKVIYVRSRFNKNHITKFDPDILLEAFVERQLIDQKELKQGNEH